MASTPERPTRQDGHLPIRDYAAIGDLHTAALVGRDGCIDWLCLPRFDSPWALGALVDPERGGRFELAPAEDCGVERRYQPDTNVLETTFSTASGTVRITDALALADEIGGGRGVEAREVLRRVEGLAGEVPMRWRLAPRFAYREPPRSVTRDGSAVTIRGEGLGLFLTGWGVGESMPSEAGAEGELVLRAGRRGLLALRAGPDGAAGAATSREDAERRLDRTSDRWRRWCADRSYDGPWREEVMRSALVLRLLTFAPTGAVVAAPTSSLPEALGGTANWDYRFSWLRDASFAVDALLRLGDDEEAGRFLEWLVDAVEERHPRLSPFYGVDGSRDLGERELDLAGYRGSRPVRVGNRAVEQRQLGNYGDVFQTAAIYVQHGHDLDRRAGELLAALADRVCEAWSLEDAGIWELPDYRHYTWSKMSCCVALDRALRLAESGHLPGGGADRWRAAADAIRDFVESRCWSPERATYVRSAGADDLDASVLLGAIMDYEPAAAERFDRTIDRLREELGDGALLYRYSEMRGSEGAFVACSFWLVHALARRGRLDEAAELMDRLVAMANDVGLYAEEIDPAGGEFLGNFPQGLSHLALVNAAVTLAEVEEGRHRAPR